ncbi:hypothetical protein [Streptomyces sp. NPDC001820]|uniref:hypothetical protein n=1 Tax=Streptomyces sp. NPDC001820 TaxID=3364613 RepID=UPI0036A1E44E
MGLSAELWSGENHSMPTIAARKITAPAAVVTILGRCHFDDFPTRGAVLMPLGITVSFVAYVIKDADTPWQRIFSLVGLAVLLAAVVSFVGLRQVAASMGEPAEGGGHSHGNAEEPEPDTHNPDEAPPTKDVPTPSESPTADRGTSSEPGHDDGHSH